MLIRVVDIRKVIGQTLSVPLFLTPRALDSIKLLSPIEGEILVENQGSRLLVKGSIKTTAELECVRCLAPFPYLVEVSFAENFVEGNAPSIGDDAVLTEEELDTFYFQGESLDLSEPIRDHILLSLPWIPLCKKDCLGLCQFCGINLNFKKCSCSTSGAEQIS